MKKKVFYLSDNGEISNLVCLDLQTIFETIASEDHNEEEWYEYTITVGWMTEEEINNLPEANF